MTINDYINIVSFAVVLLSTGIAIIRFIEKDFNTHPRKNYCQ